MDVFMLLCDHAEEVGGKLYMMGGGWNVAPPIAPANLTLAVRLAVLPGESPPSKFLIRLLDKDGQNVEIQDRPVRAEGGMESTPEGDPFLPDHLAFAIKFRGVVLDPGDYTCELQLDGEVQATARFRILAKFDSTEETKARAWTGTPEG